MQIGVRVQERQQNWTILQERNGFGSIALSGDWFVNEDPQANATQVYVRVVREEDGHAVIPWMPCRMLDNARWEVNVENIPVGGLYRIETCLQVNHNPAIEWATRGDMIHHIGVGDLWIIAGQSNSAGYGRGPVYDPPEFGVHLLRNNGNWDVATHPFNESTDTIHPENRETANPGHSPYLAFGRTVKNLTGRPVGLIQTALGGSPLKAWDPEDDGYLYQNMLRIVESAGRFVRGVLWYQGESDANESDADSYLSRFKRMVERLRSDLGIPDLPVLTVQLNRYTGQSETRSNVYWGIVREAQRRAPFELKNVHVVPALDCALSDEIHNSPAGNLLIGERLAHVFFDEIYRRSGCYRAPNIAKAVLQLPSKNKMMKPTITLHFDDVQGHLTFLGPSENLFTVVDERGEVEIDRIEIVGDSTIQLTLGRDTDGEMTVHGAHQTNPPAWLPTDTQTYMPMLSFYGFAVEG